MKEWNIWRAGVVHGNDYYGMCIVVRILAPSAFPASIKYRSLKMCVSNLWWITILFNSGNGSWAWSRSRCWVRNREIGGYGCRWRCKAWVFGHKADSLAVQLDGTVRTGTKKIVLFENMCIPAVTLELSQIESTLLNWQQIATGCNLCNVSMRGTLVGFHEDKIRS